MKSILITVLVSLTITVSAFAGSDAMKWDGPVGPLTITDETVYHAYDLTGMKAVGYFSLQGVTTGAGTVTVTYELSNVPNAKSTDYVASGADAITTAHAAGSFFEQFPATGENIFGKYIRLKLVATGEVTYTLYPNVQ